jgi:hypothetical protein
VLGDAARILRASDLCKGCANVGDGAGCLGRRRGTEPRIVGVARTDRASQRAVCGHIRAAWAVH